MNNYFSVMSLNMVAWLVSKGFEVVETVIVNNQVTFFFEKSEQLSESIVAYNSNLELKDFISCYRKVKELVNQGK
jgi:hypothetical protein